MLIPSLVGACVLFFGLLWGQPVHAYSYAEAGAEPLLEGRQVLLGALAEKDAEAASRALASVRQEIDGLDVEYATLLLDTLEEAVWSMDVETARATLNAAFALEVRRRLKSAGEQLGDYQKAKVLVVKSRAYLQPLNTVLSPGQRQQVNAALDACLEAIGKPGVFGAGAVPPDPEAFLRHRRQIDRILSEQFPGES